MISLNLLNSHLKSLERSIELGNKFHWFLSISKKNDHWFVRGGEVVIFSTDNKEALDSFLYGFGLAYAAIPEDLFNYIVQETDDYK